MNKEAHDELVSVMREMQKMTADYGLGDVLVTLKMYNRANRDYFFINAWDCIPDDCLYKNWIEILSDCSRENYRRMFNPRIIEKLRKFNKHATVDSPLLQSLLDTDGLLTIYHGHAKKTMSGSYSWTTELEIAHFFGCRNSKFMGVDDYYVVSGKVRLEDVIAHITDRDEEEVVVLNKDVKRKTKELLKCSETNDAYSNFDDVKAMIVKRSAVAT